MFINKEKVRYVCMRKKAIPIILDFRYKKKDKALTKEER